MGLGILIGVNNTPNEELTGQVGSVEVYEKIDQATSYKIRFMVDICDGDIAHALEEYTDPGSVLSVLVEVNDELVCLVKGPVSRQEAHLQHGGAGSWLEVEGTDSSQDMDREPVNHVWDNVTDADIATTILSQNYQMSTDVEATAGSAHMEATHTLNQQESDLSLVRRLAQRNGFHFWITYNADGVATGHFKSRSLNGEAETELIVNMENSNIDNLRITWDTRRPTQVQSQQVDARTLQVMGGTPISLNGETALGEQDLASISGNSPQTIHLAPPTDDSGAHQARAEAALREAQWFINATCRTSLHQLCSKIIRSHTLVDIQGAGSRHSGKYYVTGVKHLIGPVAHIMEVELARNAWGSAGEGGLLGGIF